MIVDSLFIILFPTSEYRSKRIALRIANVHKPIAILVLQVQLAHAGLSLVQQLLANKQIDAILALIEVELGVQHGFEIVERLLLIYCEFTVAEWR